MLSATIQEVSRGQENYFASISWYVIPRNHYNDDIMGTIVPQITSLIIVYSTIYSGADQRKPPKLRVTGLCVWNSSHKWPVTRKMSSFDDVIMVFARYYVIMEIRWKRKYIFMFPK